jgi:hypothetical protein
MRFMREKLYPTSDNCEPVNLMDVLDNWKAMYNEKGAARKQFRTWFPNFNKQYIRHWSPFEGTLSRNKDMLKKLRENVEKCLLRDVRVAISIYLNEHYVTGCFDTEVIFACYVMRCNNKIEAPLYLHYPLYRAKNLISSIRTSPKFGWTILLYQIWNLVAELYINWKTAKATTVSKVLWNVSDGIYMHDWKYIPIL